MRARICLVLVFLSLVALAPAQSSEATSAPAQGSAPAAKAKKAEPSALDRASSWLRSGGKEAMKRLKASQAEALVRAAPKHFAGLKSAATGLAAKIERGMGASLTEKRNLLVQLWKLRGSLDVMALLEPRTLETLTGIDAKTLAGLQKTAVSLAKQYASLTGGGAKG